MGSGKKTGEDYVAYPFGQFWACQEGQWDVLDRDGSGKRVVNYNFKAFFCQECSRDWCRHIHACIRWDFELSPQEREEIVHGKHYERQKAVA